MNEWKRWREFLPTHQHRLKDSFFTASPLTDFSIMNKEDMLDIVQFPDRDEIKKRIDTIRPGWLHEVRYNNDRTALNAELAELRKQNELLSDGLGIALACSVVCLFIMFLILMGVIAKGWAM